MGKTKKGDDVGEELLEKYKEKFTNLGSSN